MSAIFSLVVRARVLLEQLVAKKQWTIEQHFRVEELGHLEGTINIPSLEADSKSNAN